jgi:hypothetical protein
MALRGYLSSTIQLDTTSRFDKLLLAVVGGLISLGIMLIFNRFNILQAGLDYAYNILLDRSIQIKIGYSQQNSATTSSIKSLNALAGLGFILVQSIIAFVGAYLLGTVVRVRSNQPQKSDKDLQQPWETAISQSALGDTISVMTKNGKKIRGQLYRIGSPSKDYDLLLAAAEKVVDNGDNVPLGITYHHFGDISRVTFPQIKPQEESEDGNWILRQWNSAIDIKNTIRRRISVLRHGYSSIEDDLRQASIAASLLNDVYQQRIISTLELASSAGEKLRRVVENKED